MMPALPKNDSIAKGLSKLQTTFQNSAVELERRYEAASARLAAHDAARKADREAELLKEVAESTPASHSSTWAKNRDGNRVVEPLNAAVAMHTTGPRKAVYALELPFSKKELRLLRRINQKDLSPEEHQKAQKAFDRSRHLLEARLKKQEEKKRLAREANEAARTEKMRKRLKDGKLWISQPSNGSSMFGAVKYSYVSVWQGGLPGLGKRR